MQATVRGKDSARRSPVETDTGVPPWAWDIEGSLLGEVAFNLPTADRAQAQVDRAGRVCQTEGLRRT